MNKWEEIGLLFITSIVISVFITHALINYYEEEQFLIYEENPISYPNLLDEDLYAYYKDLERPQTLNYMIYVLDKTDNTYIQLYAENLIKEQPENAIEIITTHIRNIPYLPDDNSEYPQYPIETITEWKGDCEDKSILWASLLYSLGYDVCLYRFETHMGAGVNINNEYIYVDPTIDASMNSIPDKYKNQMKTQYTTDSPIILHKWTYANSSQTFFKKMINLDICIDNYGLNNNDILLSIYIHNDECTRYNNRTIHITSQSQTNIETSTEVDLDFEGIIETSIYVDDQLTDTVSGRTDD